MLRLKRNPNKEIHFVVDRSKKRFNPIFLQAFCIALFFHLILFTFFQVTHFFNADEVALPTTLTSAVYEPEISAQGIRDDQKMVYPFIPLISVPKINTDDIYNHLFAKQAEKSTVQIQFFGELGKKEILFNGIEEHATGLPETVLNYRVQVDNARGEIFWFESLQSDQYIVHLYAEKILKNVRFQPDFSSYISSGQIEVVFK